MFVLIRQASNLQQTGSDLLRRQADTRRRDLALPLQIALQLLLPGQVLLGPGDILVTQACHFVQGPRRIGQMRSCHGAQTGATGGDDAVDVVRLEDGTHRGWSRVVKYYENIRVVYEIQSRLKEWADQEELDRQSQARDSAGQPKTIPAPDKAAGTGSNPSPSQ